MGGIDVPSVNEIVELGLRWSTQPPRLQLVTVTTVCENNFVEKKIVAKKKMVKLERFIT
jgi:hypothetical protein